VSHESLLPTQKTSADSATPNNILASFLLLHAPTGHTTALRATTQNTEKSRHLMLKLNTNINEDPPRV